MMFYKLEHEEGIVNINQIKLIRELNNGYFPYAADISEQEFVYLTQKDYDSILKLITPYDAERVSKLEPF